MEFPKLSSNNDKDTKPPFDIAESVDNKPSKQLILSSDPTVFNLDAIKTEIPVQLNSSITQDMSETLDTTESLVNLDDCFYLHRIIDNNITNEHANLSDSILSMNDNIGNASKPSNAVENDTSDIVTLNDPTEFKPDLDEAMEVFRIFHSSLINEYEDNETRVSECLDNFNYIPGTSHNVEYLNLNNIGNTNVTIANEIDVETHIKSYNKPTNSQQVSENFAFDIEISIPSLDTNADGNVFDETSIPSLDANADGNVFDKISIPSVDANADEKLFDEISIPSVVANADEKLFDEISIPSVDANADGNVFDEIIESEDSDSHCSVNESSYFEFITETEASEFGIAPRNRNAVNDNSAIPETQQNRDHVIQHGDVRLFQDAPLPYDDFMENKCFIHSPVMDAKDNHLAFYMMMYSNADDVDEESRREAEKTKNKILDMYPIANKKRRRRF